MSGAAGMLRLVASFSDHAARAQLREHYARRLLMVVDGLEAVRSQGRAAEQKAATPFFGARHREEAQAAQSTVENLRSQIEAVHRNAEQYDITPDALDETRRLLIYERQSAAELLAQALSPLLRSR
jgi:hypothetical protein